MLALCGFACAPQIVSPEPDVVNTCAGALFKFDVLAARDVGAVQPLACGRVLRGPWLNLADTGCAEFQQRAIGTIIDLRTPGELVAAPDATCTQSAHTVLAPLPIPYNVNATDYLMVLNTDASMKPIFQTLAGDATGPIYIHCTYGRDRTGIVIALLLRLLGVSREDVLAEYQRTAAAGLATFPDALTAVLDELDNTGGAEAHVARLGLDPAAIARVRARLAR